MSIYWIKFWRHEGYFIVCKVDIMLHGTEMTPVVTVQQSEQQSREYASPPRPYCGLDPAKSRPWYRLDPATDRTLLQSASCCSLDPCYSLHPAVDWSLLQSASFCRLETAKACTQLKTRPCCSLDPATVWTMLQSKLCCRQGPALAVRNLIHTGPFRRLDPAIDWIL